MEWKRSEGQFCAAKVGVEVGAKGVNMCSHVKCVFEDKQQAFN